MRLRRERFFALFLARRRLVFVRFVFRGFFDSIRNINRAPVERGAEPTRSPREDQPARTLTRKLPSKAFECTLRISRPPPEGGRFTAGMTIAGRYRL